MAETKIDVELDPKNFKRSIDDLVEAVKNLSVVIENQLGREAPRSIQKLEQSAESGTSKIKKFFKDLHKDIKDSFKNAFDAGKLIAGLGLGNELLTGVKEVFNLEKAFDKLNSRLQLTGKTYQDFKKEIGESVAKTGQKLEDIFPGVEIAASKGNIKSTKDLSMIAKSLGEVKATTGEGTESLADTVVEILKNQEKEITGKNFKATVDALQGTRVTGAFRTAGEAGNAIKNLTNGISADQLKKMGLGTRELGGLSATASRSGEQGQEILKTILQTATEAGGKEKLNAIFGTSLFNKSGQLQSEAFQNINKKRFGQYSEQALASSTGADQAGLSRFLDAMKTGMDDFKKVTQGANETGSQFKISTNNLVSGLDQFREGTKNAGRKLGYDLSETANALLKGDISEFKHQGLNTLINAWDNKGSLAAGAGTALAATILTGSAIEGLRKKKKKKGSAEDLIESFAGGGGLNSSGATPVYVVNAAEIGNGGLGGAVDNVVKLGVAGTAAVLGATALTSGYAGYSLSKTKIGEKSSDYLADKFLKSTGLQLPSSNLELTKRGNQSLGGLSPENLAAAVSRGTEQGMHKANRSKEVHYTNPSTISGRGGHL